MPTAFLSISVTEATAMVTGMLARLHADTGWRPTRTKPIAGTLAYSRYTEYGDWPALDRFVIAFADEITGVGQPRFASASANVVS
jgi:menaquinone-dependent protoporphyrinogen IX oxidase